MIGRYGLDRVIRQLGAIGDLSVNGWRSRILLYDVAIVVLPDIEEPGDLLPGACPLCQVPLSACHPPYLLFGKSEACDIEVQFKLLPGEAAYDAMGPEAVSYTHLRAHETDSYLVCRLLLEKK